MSWPIPKLIQKEPLSPPSLWFWIIFFIFLQIIAIIIGIFILNYENPKQIVGICLIPATLGWIILYIFWAIKYFGFSLLTKYWNKEIQKTDLLWKEWSKNKIAVLANVLLSSEEDGINKILEANPPVFPQKGRPLYSQSAPIEELLENIHQQLETQYPEYNSQVNNIFLLIPKPSELPSKEQYYQNILTQQWGSKSIKIFYNIEDILLSLDNDLKKHKLILLLSLQLWNDNNKNYSEFITTQLLSSTSFIKEQNIKQINGYIGRPMTISLSSFEKDINKFISYGCDDPDKIKTAWANNTSQDFNANAILELEKHKISISIYNINYSFGPAGPLSLIFSIAAALEAKKKQQTEQLIFNKIQDNTSIYRIS